jgi:predicted permease
VSETLKRGGRGSTSDRAHHRLRNGLIVAEVALALVLLTGAGMFIRGLERFAQRDPGWRMDGLVIGHLALPDRKYPTPADQQRFFQQLEDRLGAIPGVERAAIGWSLPVWGFSSSSNYAVEGQPDPPRGQAPLTYVNGVTPTYFETLGVPLVRGRAFTRADTTNAPAVAIINETMAQRLWPNENPIGKRIGNFEPDDRDWIEIVGVVKDVGFAANFSEPDTRLQMYRPLAQNSVGFVTVALRSIVASDALVTSLRKAVAELDPDQPVYEAGPARESVGRIMRNYGLVSGILAAFAGLGLLLTAIGIYGVMSGFVAQRRNELGVRLALGAQLRDVLTLVLSRGMHLVIWGMILGLVGAWGLARLFSATMPQLPTQAPLAVLSVGLVLACVALLACWLPARRATRVNPMEALRAE